MPSDLLTDFAARLKPAHTALLVIDMQNDFCSENGYVETVVGRDVSACRAVVPAITSLARMAREVGVPVFWIKANYDPERLPPGMRTKQLEKSEAISCGTGSWGSEFYGVAPAPEDAIVEKHSFSAFVGTDVETRLQTQGIRTLIFAGVQTNVCVESSARDAVCRGFYAVLADDCVASHTAPLHDATLKNIQFLFGDVVGSKDIAKVWGVSPD